MFNKAVKGDSPQKARKKHDIVPKLLCVIVAIIMWQYVTQIEAEDYEETFNGVSVELVNTSILESETGLYVYSGYGNTANVTVSGRRSEINRYTSESIRVYADVSNIDSPGRHAVRVETDAPSGLSVTTVSLYSINVYVDVRTTKEINVRPKISSAVVGSGCELGEPVPEYGIVSVTGPNEILRNVDYAQISLDLGNVSSTVSAVGELELISSNGESVDMRYVQLNRNEIRVTVPVYATKEVPLSVNYKYGYYNDDNVKITLSPDIITVKGDPEELANLDKISVATLDEQKITGDVTQVYILNLPAGLTSVDDVERVYVSISHVGTEIHSYSLNTISVNGAGNMKYSVETPSLTVRLRGKPSSLEKLESSDITASVNISEFSSVTGTVTVNAEINVDGASDDVYPVGEYPVQIKIG